MLSTIARFLRAGERVNITLSADPSGGTRVLIQPVLGKEPDGLKDDAKQLRAALATPLIITVADWELDDLPQRLAAAADARDLAADRIDAYVAGVKPKAQRVSVTIAKEGTRGTAPAAAAAPAAEEAPPPQTEPADSGVNLFENL